MNRFKWFLKLGDLKGADIMNLERKAHELLNCSYSFHQGVDDKGQAQTSVNIGGICLAYDGLPTSEIIEWAMSSDRFMNGTLALMNSDDQAVDKVFFEQGACVYFALDYREGDILTALQIQPNKMSLGEEVISNDWTGVYRSNTDNVKSTASNILFKLPQPIGKTGLKLSIEGQNYYPNTFNIEFTQEVDHKGEPQQKVHGGEIHFSVPHIDDSLLSQWMTKEIETKNGVFTFIREGESSPLVVKFEEAYCVELATRQGRRGGIITDFTISANGIMINNKSIHNGFNL